MWAKQCHQPPIWEWFIPPIHGNLGEGSNQLGTNSATRCPRCLVAPGRFHQNWLRNQWNKNNTLGGIKSRRYTKIGVFTI
jgi:hypothetical protein